MEPPRGVEPRTYSLRVNRAPLDPICINNNLRRLQRCLFQFCAYFVPMRRFDRTASDKLLAVRSCKSQRPAELDVPKPTGLRCPVERLSTAP